MSDRDWTPPGGLLTLEWLRSELNAEAAAKVSRDELLVFDRLAGGPDTDIVLFGAGNLGRRTLAGLRHIGVEPIAFVDNAPGLQGRSLDGVDVITPSDAAARFGESAAFVPTAWSPSRQHVHNSIAHVLGELGVRRVVPFVPLFWRHSVEFLPYYSLDLPHKLFAEGDAIREAYATFRDDHSREQFLIQLTYLISMMDTVDLPRGLPAQTYFPTDLVELGSGEVFVDCGAFDGDTVEEFLKASGGQFGALVAFEPDPSAAAKLGKLVDELPARVRDLIRVEQKAVGSTAGFLKFEGGGTPGSRVSATGNLSVECVTLDAALADRAPTFVKMDIEGAEHGALLGAADTIRAHRPVLAICVYHLQSDLYRLPTLIDELCSDYSLFLRRQGTDGDLVCFAIPNERLRR